MTTNSGDNYDPSLPLGVDLESIGLEEEIDYIFSDYNNIEEYYNEEKDFEELL